MGGQHEIRQSNSKQSENIMKNLKTQLAVLLLSLLCSLTVAYGQLTPSQDAYTNTADPTTNYGAKTLLDVESASQTTYIQFNLSSIPSGYTSADITQATLKLYVNAVTKAGSFNVDYVNGTWTESTIDASNAPALGSTIAASVPLTTADKNQYILINVTAAVQAWLSGTANDGIALVGNSPLNASFDSKESTSTSHAAELDIVFAGGGTLTGIETASGSGLTGGGTSGTLNLSLTNACAANQVLQWNGTSWLCAAVGTGTITGVTAGTDLTGGGTSGNVTLNLNTAAINGLYAQLAAANTFSANQTVNGTLTTNSSGTAITGTSSASGYGVEGSSLSNVGVYGSGATGVNGVSTGNGIGVNGTSLALSGVTYGVEGSTVSAGGYGVYGIIGNSTGTTAAVYGTTSSTAGYGVQGVGPNVGVYGQASGISHEGTLVALGRGVWGDTGGATREYAAVLGSADDNWAGYFQNNSPNAASLVALNDTETTGGVAFAAVLPSTLGGATAALFGDAGCGTGFMALQLGQDGMSGCNNYTLMGDLSGNTYLNAVSGGTIHLRVNNGDQLTVTTGKVDVIGTLSKGGGSFKIDHPLDPANKYLYHSFVESPDMMNIYNGNVTTDGAGVATVTLPDWFEALNRDFRYQLTVIGQFAQAIVASEIGGNQFSIRTDKPDVKVSWQVTGIRQDAFANANRIPVEVEKAPGDRGRYLYPEAIGAPQTARIGYEAPPPGSEQIVHHRPLFPPRGNASPSQPRTPLSQPIPQMPAPLKTAALPHPAASASKPELNQK
jgi:hypothetical protein